MLAAFVILCLGFLHLSQSSPPDCQELVRPLDHVLPQDLEGKWTLVAGGLNSTSALERFKRRDSALITCKTINGTSMRFMRNDGLNESCHFVDIVITLEGSGFRLPNLTVIFLHTTCPDCLVIHFDKDDKSQTPLYLISRRREMSDAEIDEFRAQVQCLRLSKMELMDPTKKLCERDVSDKATTQEVTVEGGHSA